MTCRNAPGRRTADIAWIRVNDSGCDGSVTRALRDKGAVVVSGVEPEAQQLLTRLRSLGSPLPYYGDSAGTLPAFPDIWRVRYDPAAASERMTHAIDGPLRPHSSQSLRDPRPSYFCMLMVNAGWLDMSSGFTGRSVLANWADAFHWIRDRSEDMYVFVRERLTSEIVFPDGVRRRLAYQLTDSRNDFDLGVRMNSGLVDMRTFNTAPDREAIDILIDAAERVAVRTQLAAGDLVILDNDRWAHGRESVAGARTGCDGGRQLNPRELWSLTLG